MFKKLKFRLLTLNVISIVIIMLVAFTSVYLITYNNVNGSIGKMLSDAAMIKPFKEDLTKEKPPEHEFFPERLIAFNLNLDLDQNIFAAFATFENDDDLFETLKTIALEAPETERLTYDDTTWAYRVVYRGDFMQIHFVDVTAQVDILSRLVFTFVIVAIVMILTIVLVSNFLTNQSLKPVKKAFEKQNQFVSDASHELKTPLAVIQSNADVLSRNCTPETIHWVDNIRQEIHRMKSLTENLLDLSRFDADYSMSFDIVNISDLLEGLSLNFETIGFEKHLNVTTEIEEDLIIEGNEDQLSQSLVILLDNAMKYSDDSVHISLSQRHGHVYLKLQNSGSLIPEEDQPKIFDRFYRIDRSRSETKGYGLGLAIAKVIINNHHGKLEYHVEDNLNTFLMKLPLKKS